MELAPHCSGAMVALDPRHVPNVLSPVWGGKHLKASLRGKWAASTIGISQRPRYLLRAWAPLDNPEIWMVRPSLSSVATQVVPRVQWIWHCEAVFVTTSGKGCGHPLVSLGGGRADKLGSDQGGEVHESGFLSVLNTVLGKGRRVEGVCVCGGVEVRGGKGVKRGAAGRICPRRCTYVGISLLLGDAMVGVNVMACGHKRCMQSTWGSPLKGDR